MIICLYNGILLINSQQNGVPTMEFIFSCGRQLSHQISLYEEQQAVNSIIDIDIKGFLFSGILGWMVRRDLLNECCWRRYVKEEKE